MSPAVAPPKTLGGMLRQLGPGLIITGSIVGSGELIMTTKLGAEVGFTLLWFIILGCMIKVFIQIELGRFAIARNLTTLEALNLAPGPRWIVSWVLWLWLIMFICIVFQVAGIVGGVVMIFAQTQFNLPEIFWTLLITASCIALLMSGRYKVVETAAAIMVALFTMTTLFAVIALAWTPYAIDSSQLAQGMSFHLTDDFTTAFGAFGIIGVGASELIYYPYWCLEKGYARHAGSRDNSAEWYENARGWMKVMQLDAWLSMVVYTGATIAFYLLGAAVLHGKGLEVSNNELIQNLSMMYKESFGPWGLWVFLIGAFIVLYSTFFLSTASNARLFADGLGLFKAVKYADAEHKKRWVRIGSIVLPLASMFLFISFGTPVSLVTVGALAQAVMLPFLGLAAVWFLATQTPKELKPGKLWLAFVWFACLCMMATGAYSAWKIFAL